MRIIDFTQNYCLLHSLWVVLFAFTSSWIYACYFIYFNWLLSSRCSHEPSLLYISSTCLPCIASTFFYFLTHPSMFLLRSYRSFYVIHPWLYKQCVAAYTFVLVLDRQTTTSSGYKQIELFRLLLDIIETFSKPSWTIGYKSSVVVFFELLLVCKHVLLRH